MKEDLEFKPALKDVVVYEIGRGAIYAIFRFAEKHNLRQNATDKCESPINELSTKLMAEFEGRPYPFKESFKEAITSAAKRDSEMIFMVYDPADEKLEAVRGLCRIIGSAVVLEFLERNIDDIRKVHDEICA